MRGLCLHVCMHEISAFGSLDVLPSLHTAPWHQVVLRTPPNPKRRRAINALSGAANKTSKVPKGSGSGSGKTNKAPADTFIKSESNGGIDGGRNHGTAVTNADATLQSGGNSSAAAADASAVPTKQGVQSPAGKPFATGGSVGWDAPAASAVALPNCAA